MSAVLIVHNLLRWAVLIFGLITIIRAISGLTSGRMYNGGDNKMNLFFMISCDVQLLIGLVLFFGGDWFRLIKTSGMGEVMKNPIYRFFTVEHGSMMILAWILVHVGRTTVKRSVTDKAKHRKALLFFGIALVIILASIPWPFRELTGRPYFPAL